MSRGVLRMPCAAIRRPFLLRGAQMWLGVRLLASAVVMQDGGDPLALPLGSALVMVCLAVAAALAQTARLREWALLGNLGVRSPTLALMFAVPALLGELVVRLTGSWLR